MFIVFKSVSQCEKLKTADCFVQLNSTDPHKRYGQILKIFEIKTNKYFLIQYFEIFKYNIIKNVRDAQLKKAINKFYDFFHVVELMNTYDIVDVSTVINKCVCIPYEIKKNRSHYVITPVVDPYDHD
jgi:hypothetical protein